MQEKCSRCWGSAELGGHSLRIRGRPFRTEMRKRFIQRVVNLWKSLSQRQWRLIQNSLDSGVVPEDWRVANVTPLFKKGGREKTGKLQSS